MHSARYRIAQYLRTVLEAVATAQSAVLVINPALPVGVKDKGPRVLFLLDRGEELIDQPGQQEKRRGKFVVGALARGDDDADTLHFAARLAFRGLAFGLDSPRRPRTPVGKAVRRSSARSRSTRP